MAFILLLALPCLAVNRTVKAGGGGDFTTIQACATAMAAGDTCTVFAGTYNESVTVSAGTVGNYKTITVNGTDTVSVLHFTLNSHTKVIGNCPEKQGTVTTAACGFFISNTTPTSCITFGSTSATDIYIKNNVLYACGKPMISANSHPGLSYIYIQGNTINYSGITASYNPSHTQCDDATITCTGDAIVILGDHILIENNDLSHYSLGVQFNISNGIFRNNVFHDQYEYEGRGNHHTDMFFSEPGDGTTNVQYNVIEGNLQRMAVGSNAKGPLSQDDTCAGLCFNLITRFNTVSRIGSGWITNDKTWPNVKAYNNTYADLNSDGSVTFGAGNYSPTAANASFLNEIYYYTRTPISDYNPYACNNTTCDYGNNLYWCTGTCTSIHGHTYGSGSFTSDPGNLNANPLFASFVGAGNVANDYHLQTGSPAIGTGTYLTTVAASDSGTGTSLVVNDAAYFQDGYGLSGVSSDCVAVNTAANHVCVTAVNYATNTLTLASSITRSSGQGVYLYSKSDGVQVLTGTTPDMGAYSFSANTPVAQLAPTSLNFGSQTVYTSSPTQSITLTNVGTATLTITSISITGLNTSDFSQTTNCGASLAVGISCTITATFSPLALGARTASVSVSDNASGSPHTAGLSGTGTDPQIYRPTAYTNNSSGATTNPTYAFDGILSTFANCVEDNFGNFCSLTYQGFNANVSTNSGLLIVKNDSVASQIGTDTHLDLSLDGGTTWNSIWTLTSVLNHGDDLAPILDSFILPAGQDFTKVQLRAVANTCSPALCISHIRIWEAWIQTSFQQSLIQGKLAGSVN